MTDIRSQLPVGLLLPLSPTNNHFTITGGSNALPLDDPSRSIHDGQYDLAGRHRINNSSLSMPGRDGAHTEPPTPPPSGPSSFDEPATRLGYTTQAKDAEENPTRDAKASRQTVKFSPTATRLSSVWDPAILPPPMNVGGQIMVSSAAAARYPVPPPPRPPPDAIFGARENPSRTREAAHAFTVANTHPPPPPPPPPSPPISAAQIGPSLASVPEPSRIPKSAPHPPPPPPPPPPNSVSITRPLEDSRISVETPTLSRETLLHPRVPQLTSRPLLPSFRDPSPSSSGYSESDDDSVERDPYKALNERRFPPTLPADFGRSNSQVRGTVSKVTARIFQFENVLSPSLNDSSDDDSDDSGGTVDTEIDLQNVWAQLKERRQKLYDMRQRMAAKRRALRDIRRMKDEADNAFMSLLRPILVKSRRGAGATSDDMLDKRLLEMQRARTEYGWQESEYEGLETLLDEEEIELDKLETRFFSLLAVGRARSARHPRPQDEAEAEQLEESQDVPIELRGISRDGPPDDSHPLWLALLSALADLQLAREDLDDLLLQREQVQYDMEVKKNAGLAPADDEWEFLNEFPKEEREKKDKLIRWTEEVARLKRLCAEKGAMKKNLPFRVAYLLDPLIDDDDMALDPAPATSLAHKVFPVILSQPEHVVLTGGPYTEDGALRRAAELPDDDPTKETQRRLAIKEHRIHELLKLTENDNKLSFITRWLLHQLRTSPMSAELLYLTFTRDLQILDPYKWQMDVLQFWFKDETFKTADDLASARTQGEVDDLEVEFDVDLFGHYDNSYAFSESLLPTEESNLDETD